MHMQRLADSHTDADFMIDSSFTCWKGKISGDILGEMKGLLDFLIQEVKKRGMVLLRWNFSIQSVYVNALALSDRSYDPV